MSFVERMEEFLVLPRLDIEPLSVAMGTRILDLCLASSNVSPPISTVGYGERGLSVEMGVLQ